MQIPESARTQFIWNLVHSSLQIRARIYFLGSSRSFSKMRFLDNAFDTVFTMKDKLYAAADSSIIFEIDPKTLETLNKVNFSKEFPGDAKIKFTTAHPQRTDEGSVINISVTHAQKSTYDVIEIPPSTGEQGEHPLEGGKLLCSIPPTSGVAYIHSFCITENYVVVPETPLVLNLWEAYTRKFKDSSAAEWFQWKENQRSRFHVVDRKQGSYAGIFTADPFFVFHQVNAFEDDGKIFLDACCFHDHKIIDQTYLHNMRSPIVPGEKKLDVPDVRRYELPLKTLEM
ncbi:Retinoid isomerohydrolase [Desmophyllum pertusum]|uniref:Retinoid isomerohydrolase n=1 Tax=Desmophyllum pertusum TaxID=174260 RepID=A0A9W9Z7W4_9CNID|nr:Retinoid isomerohydrolase [Desmophyllum pertusum]